MVAVERVTLEHVGFVSSRIVSGFVRTVWAVFNTVVDANDRNLNTVVIIANELVEEPLRRSRWMFIGAVRTVVVSIVDLAQHDGVPVFACVGRDFVRRHVVVRFIRTVLAVDMAVVDVHAGDCLPVAAVPVIANEGIFVRTVGAVRFTVVHPLKRYDCTVVAREGGPVRLHHRLVAPVAAIVHAVVDGCDLHDLPVCASVPVVDEVSTVGVWSRL